MTSLQYPADQNGNPGPTDTYTYDAMGRLSNYGATWNPDGTLATFNGQSYFTAMDMQYIYPAGQNNGRISQTVDNVGGETVNYTYDTLNRLATATATATGGNWGESYSYDGWGNLNGKTPTAGTAPVYSANPDPSRNGGPDPTVVDSQLDVESHQINGAHDARREARHASCEIHFHDVSLPPGPQP